jgi:hypothetical protein
MTHTSDLSRVSKQYPECPSFRHLVTGTPDGWPRPPLVTHSLSLQYRGREAIHSLSIYYRQRSSLAHVRRCRQHRPRVPTQTKALCLRRTDPSSWRQGIGSAGTGPFLVSGESLMPPYRKLLAATCRTCGELTMPSDLKPDAHTWSRCQYVCRQCSRAASRAYARTDSGKAHWQRRQSDTAAHTRYRAAHRRLTAARGKAASHKCYCGQAAEEWALLPLVPRLTDGPYVYSPDPADYTPMCRSHHRIWDGQFKRLCP